MEPTTHEIAETPPSIRARLGLRQTDVAERAPLSPQTVSVIDRGGRASVASVRKYANVVRVSPGYLLDAMDLQRSLAKRANLFRRGDRR